MVRVSSEETHSRPTAAHGAGDTHRRCPLLRFPSSLPQEGEVLGARYKPRQHVQRTICCHQCRKDSSQLTHRSAAVYPGCTWNVLTLNVTGYQTALVQELERYNIAIAGLTEARLQDSDLSTVDEQD